MNSAEAVSGAAKPRRGLSLIELMVAATLIICGLALIGKLTVTSGRMWQQTLHERVALEELSNQLERLVALPAQQRDAALSQLTASPHAAAMLPGARLTSRSIHDSDGSRVEVEIDWDRPTPANPITLVGWMDVMDSDSDDPQEPRS